MIAATVACTALWWVLAEGDLSTWPAALVAVPAAVAAYRALGGRTPRVQLISAATFVPWFFAQSVRGGVDVALRALAPRVRIDPVLLDVPVRLRDDAARVTFVYAVSLLPGTLSAQLQGDVLSVHLLDAAIGEAGVRAVEARVGALFGISLSPR